MEIKVGNKSFIFISILLNSLLIFPHGAIGFETTAANLTRAGCSEDIRGNSSDCSSYVICLHGKEVNVACPTGLEFNQKLKICDWPENSLCTASPTLAEGNSTSTPKTNENENQNENEIHVDSSTSTVSPVVVVSAPHGDSPRFAPYVDVTQPGMNLSQIMRETGQKDFTLAFVLGSSGGCVPKWGAEKDLNDRIILGGIRDVQEQGGRMIVAFGGAIGPYLEHLCTSSKDLANAYKFVLDTVKTNHLDVDVEAPIDLILLNRALAQVQTDRPSTTVSYTLMVQAEDYGLNLDLGLKTIQSAKSHGVHVDIVNGMTMEYGASSPDWGDSVIGAAKAILKQMKSVWPEKSENQLKRMLGITPLLGRNFNGKLFLPEHGKKLVNWANANKIGLLSFWSIGRDNGGCPNGPIKPTCSSISQRSNEFTKIFQGFKD